MSDRVAILLKGSIAAEGTPSQLTASGSALTKISISSDRSLLSQNGHTFPAVTQHRLQEEYNIYYSTEPGQTVVALIQYLENAGDKLVDLRVERPTLEERFLEITQDH
jgi:ABC-2 type transport system ATP-binding protein